MVLAASAVRIMKRAGKVAFAAAVITALAGGLWQGVGALVRDGNDSAKAGGPPLIVYSEFGSSSDTVWSARADDPTQRTRLATISHAPEYGISAALSPDRKRIAYTVLPPDAAPAIDSPAEVWVMDADGHNRKRLAADADLPVAPVWSPDSAAVVFRRSDGSSGHFQLVAVTTGGDETALFDSADGLLPVGFTPSGALFFVRLSSSGSDLGVIRPDGITDDAVAHLSDDFVRDWHLSPDGKQLSYLAARPLGDKVSYGAEVLDLKALAGAPFTAAAAVSASAVDEFSPVWRPDGSGVTIGRLNALAAGAPVLQVVALGGPPVRLLPAPPQGFDVPLSWSPDAAYLAVRFFEGNSVEDPGRSWVTVAGADGARHTVSPNSDVDVLGWADGGG
jgi:dipeptidyl aminopeptidase/acylaminoacyl peptidase